MAFFDFLRAAPKLTDDIFDSKNGLLAQAGSWIGSQQFTPQEQSIANAEMISSVQEFVVATLHESTDRSKTRREIAVFFIKFYALLVFMCGMTYPIDHEWSMVWFKLATAGTVGGLVISIGVFFFGSHAVARHNESKK